MARWLTTKVWRERVRDLLADEAGVVRGRLFGGLCFLLRGNMCVGVVKDEAEVRAGPEGL